MDTPSADRSLAISPKPKRASSDDFRNFPEEKTMRFWRQIPSPQIVYGILLASYTLLWAQAIRFAERLWGDSYLSYTLAWGSLMFTYLFFSIPTIRAIHDENHNPLASYFLPIALVAGFYPLMYYAFTVSNFVAAAVYFLWCGFLAISTFSSLHQRREITSSMNWTRALLAISCSGIALVDLVVTESVMRSGLFTLTGFCFVSRSRRAAPLLGSRISIVISIALLTAICFSSSVQRVLVIFLS